MSKGILIALACMGAPPERLRELPPGAIHVKDTTPGEAIDKAFRELALPCPDRVHINEPISGDEGLRLGYRPHDMYADCPDAMDFLAKTRANVGERLLQVASKAKTLPERYRAAWVLVQRGNPGVAPILLRMGRSASLEERYLGWNLYARGVREKKLAAPRSFDTPIARCRAEKNRYVREEVMDFLGACKAREAVPLLTEALNDDSHYSAVVALGSIGDPKTVPAIIKAASRETCNRHIYHGVLGRIGSDEAVDYLIRHVDEGCFAIEALFETRSPKALPVLEKQLEKLRRQPPAEQLDLVYAQVCVLRLKHKDPRAHLMRLVKDRKQSKSMRQQALAAMRSYDPAPYADDLLALYRAEKDDYTRMFYIRLLRDLPGKKITEAMIAQALEDDKDCFHSDYDLLAALNERLNTSHRTLKSLVEHLRRQRLAREK